MGLRLAFGRALQPFASRRAFIYVLEMLAQVFPVITFARRLPLHWLAFIDNVAGQFALMKGYGRALWEVGASAPRHRHRFRGGVLGRA